MALEEPLWKTRKRIYQKHRWDSKVLNSFLKILQIKKELSANFKLQITNLWASQLKWYSKITISTTRSKSCNPNSHEASPPPPPATPPPAMLPHQNSAIWEALRSQTPEQAARTDWWRPLSSVLEAVRAPMITIAARSHKILPKSRVIASSTPWALTRARFLMSLRLNRGSSNSKNKKKLGIKRIKYWMSSWTMCDLGILRNSISLKIVWFISLWLRTLRWIQWIVITRSALKLSEIYMIR